MKHSLVFHLIRLGKTVQKSTNFKASPISLSYSQAAAVMAIFLEKEMSQKEIATRLHLEPASVVTLVDELVKLGLVRRESPDGDRRKYHIKLTEKGVKNAGLIRQKVLALDQKIAKVLKTQQTKAFAKTIDQITDYLKQMKGHSPNGPMAPKGGENK